jgi:predicted lipoprotein with Yx(FWY)xxD motif
MRLSTRHPGAVAAALAVAGILSLAACNANAGGGSSAASSAESAVTSPSVAGSESEAEAEAYELKVATTSAGETLTGEDGMTLYYFAKDSKGTSACTGDCAATWPPFTLEGNETATAGEGVQASLLDTIARPEGTTQVSYADHPLYYYAADQAEGDATGQGIGGIWFIASPDGNLPSSSTEASAAASSRY